MRDIFYQWKQEGRLKNGKKTLIPNKLLKLFISRGRHYFFYYSNGTTQTNTFLVIGILYKLTN